MHVIFTAVNAAWCECAFRLQLVGVPEKTSFIVNHKETAGK
jgi:hypothetical protein